MNYELLLNNGQVITFVNAEIDTEKLTQLLNNREVTFVNIGNSVLNKNLIGTIIPKVETV